MSVAVLPGRFQPFHRGHLHAVQQAQRRHRVVIAINERDVYGAVDNPLPAEVRKHMIRACLPDAPIIALPGAPGDGDWYHRLASLTDIDVGISDDEMVKAVFHDAGHVVESPAVLRPDYYNGTRIRDRMRGGQEWHHLIPESAAAVLQQTGGITRIKEIPVA